MIFPSLYSLAVKRVKIAEVWDSSGGEGTWNPRFMKALIDWEIEDAEPVLMLLSSRRANQMGKDRLICKRKKWKVLYEGRL